MLRFTSYRIKTRRVICGVPIRVIDIICIHSEASKLNAEKFKSLKQLKTLNFNIQVYEFTVLQYSKKNLRSYHLTHSALNLNVFKSISETTTSRNPKGFDSTCSVGKPTNDLLN